MGKDQSFDKDKIKDPSQSGSETGTGTEGQTDQSEFGQDSQTETGSDTSNQPS